MLIVFFCVFTAVQQNGRESMILNPTQVSCVWCMHYGGFILNTDEICTVYYVQVFTCEISDLLYHKEDFNMDFC